VKVTLDANILISRNISLAELSSGFYLSAIVLQELAAGAADETAIKQLDVVRRIYEKKGRILVPTFADWWIAGTVLNSLQRGRRAKRSRLIPKISIEERYRITNDVLLARTARRAGVTVVTDNLSDFEKIRKFCAVQVMSGAEYFDD
jgi:predicted nucleic acid-binding protein